MAFKFFKKKEKDFPAEEKAEVLNEDELPNLPPLPEPPKEDSFGKGFRSPEELKPPTLPQLPELPKPPMLPHPPEPPTELPPFKAPEPLPIPQPKPAGVEMKIKSEFGPVPKVKGAPHIYIRIDKYKEVMNTIKELGEEIKATKQDLEEIHEISENERDKIKEAAEVLLQIEKLLSYLEKTFTSPEE
ncbi:MAG: hypothetical protein J7K73_02095 [Nanoarchaeota archaeon]|nr:hypothetical protein [Nanoarchaeota archaeon]